MQSLETLASQLSYATTVKEVARVRIQCTLPEWEKVKKAAKKIHVARESRG